MQHATSIVKYLQDLSQTRIKLKIIVKRWKLWGYLRDIFQVYLRPIDRIFLVAAPLALRQPFNRIAEHRPGHDTAMLLKERLF